MTAVRTHITEELADEKIITTIKTGDPALNRKAYYKKLARTAGTRNEDTQGVILRDGRLKAEQMNQRLMKADNRFHL